jgi:hypothetical protein
MSQSSSLAGRMRTSFKDIHHTVERVLMLTDKALRTGPDQV